MLDSKFGGLNPKAKDFLEKFILKRSLDDKDIHARSKEFTKQYNALEKRVNALQIAVDKNEAFDQLAYSIKILEPTAKSPNYESAFRHLTYVGELVDASIKRAQATPPKPLTGADRSNFIQANPKTTVVVREQDRAAYVKKTLKGMNAAALKLDAGIDQLRKDRAAATSLGDMTALEEEYRGKIAAREQLGQRIAQFDHFEKTADERINGMLEAEALLKDGDSEMKAILKAYETGKGSKIDALDEASSSVHFPFLDSLSKAEDWNQTRSDQVASEAKRVLRGDTVYPGEPDVTALSTDQAKLLNSRLELAAKILKASHQKKVRKDKTALEKNLKYVQVLHNAVNKDMSFFKMKRSVGLPGAPEPKVDQFKALLTQMDGLDAQILDLNGRGDPQAGSFAKRSAALRKKINAADQAKPRDFSGCETDIEKLAEDLKKVLEAQTAPADTKGRSGARKTAAVLGTQLASKLFNAKPLSGKDADLVDVPGKEWGPGGKPDNAIPYAQIITIYDDKGEPTYHRIDMRKEKGTYVTRRTDKEIPRSTLDLMKGRVDTLNTMSQTLADGCEDVLTAYATETANMMKACTSKKGRAQFAAVEKQITELEKNGLKKKVVQTYRSNQLFQLEADWSDFRNRQPSMMPEDAYKEIFDKGGLKERVEAAVKKAEEIEGDYKIADGHIFTLFTELHSQGTQLQHTTVGTNLQSFLKKHVKRILKLNAKSDNPDLALEQKIEAALKTIKASGLKSSDYQGPIRTKYEEARRYAEMKTEGGVKKGKELALEAYGEVEQLNLKLEGWMRADDKALMAAAADILKTIESTATGSEGESKRRAEYNDQLKAYKKKEKEVIKAASGKVNRKEIANRLKMLDARQKSIAKDLKTYEQFENATNQMAKLLPELDTLKEMAEKDSKGTLVGPGHMKVDKRFGVFAKSVQALSDIAKDVVKVRARPKASDDQLKDTKITKGLDDTEASLALVAQIADLSALDKACQDVQKKGRRSKAKKREEREKALALLHKARARIENHPAVQLYRDNRFDGGQQFAIVRNNLHNLEVGILASVNPRQSG